MQPPSPLLRSLRAPSSVAFHDGYLYVAETTRVTRYSYGSDGSLGSPEMVIPDLPSGGHFTRTVVFGPDGQKLSDAVENEIEALMAGGLEQGLAPAARKVWTPRSPGVEFSRLRVDFSRSLGRFTIHDGVVKGPAIGATVDGYIDYMHNDEVNQHNECDDPPLGQCEQHADRTRDERSQDGNEL